MIITPSRRKGKMGDAGVKRRWVKRFDVFSLGWKQAERQTLRYSDDEEHFLVLGRDREAKDRGADA